MSRYLYTSSACIYPEYLQDETRRAAAARGGRLSGAAAGRLRLGEARHRAALPLLPRGPRRSRRASSASTTSSARSARGTGGREKAPAAMCRKVAVAKLTRATSEVEIWGDGEQTRSFCYVDDCVEGLHRLMASDYTEPLNLGQDRLIIDQRARRSGGADRGRARSRSVYVDGPQGVRGRNSDNTRLREVLGWEPRDLAGGRPRRARTRGSSSRWWPGSAAGGGRRGGE